MADLKKQMVKGQNLEIPKNCFYVRKPCRRPAMLQGSESNGSESQPKTCVLQFIGHKPWLRFGEEWILKGCVSCTSANTLLPMNTHTHAHMHTHTHRERVVLSVWTPSWFFGNSVSVNIQSRFTVDGSKRDLQLWSCVCFCRSDEVLLTRSTNILQNHRITE